MSQINHLYQYQSNSEEFLIIYFQETCEATSILSAALEAQLESLNTPVGG